MLLLTCARQASEPKRNRQILAVFGFSFSLQQKLMAVTSKAPVLQRRQGRITIPLHCDLVAASSSSSSSQRVCVWGFFLGERECALCVAFPTVTVVVTLFSVTRANGVQGWAWHRPMGNRRDSKDGLLLAAPTHTIRFSCSYWFNSVPHYLFISFFLYLYIFLPCFHFFFLVF
jgi:hypothetical protein